MQIPFLLIVMNQEVERVIFSFFRHTPTEGQRRACSSLVDFLYDQSPSAAFLLKGYAGTGKTSLLGALIKTAPCIGIRTVLLAPTGRAAKVLSGYAGQPAFTIHKKIYMTMMDHATGSVRTVRAINKYSYTLFIVDEASMIGLDDKGGVHGRNLLDDLVDYVYSGDHCRLLLMGDPAQLPPVGMAESLALDVDYLQAMYNLKFHQAELTEVVRQESDSGILHNASVVRQHLSSLYDGEPISFPVFHDTGFCDVIRISGEELEETLFHEYSVGSNENVAIICRTNKRVNVFNQAIRNRILFREEDINAGDYLMVVKNNYYWLEDYQDVSFIANGDIIEVLSVRNRQELYGFHFVDVTARMVDYPNVQPFDCKLVLESLFSDASALSSEQANDLYNAVMDDYSDISNARERMSMVKNDPYYNALQIKFSYAMTCHKAQGGQWPVVIIDQGYVVDDMFNKEFLRWLYTAFTRASEKVYLLNFDERLFDDV